MKKDTKMKFEKKTVANLVVGDILYSVIPVTAIKGGIVEVYDYKKTIIRKIEAPDVEMMTRVFNDEVTLRVTGSLGNKSLRDTFSNKEDLQEVLREAHERAVKEARTNLERAQKEFDAVSSWEAIFNDPATYESDEDKGRNLKMKLTIES
jgi:hypothetical protein